VLKARPARAEFAPAKVNLTLHVAGRRADGYHEIDSLVVFADVGDRVSFEPADTLDLVMRGPTAAAAGPAADNLVLKAARLLAERVTGLRLGRFTLEKRLPVAAGLGGGSSDAAAALRLLAQVNDLALDDPRIAEAARLTGADVPVCLDPKPRVMRGIGEVLSAPLGLAKLPAVLVNPRVSVPTKDVFGRLAAPPLPPAYAASDDAPTSIEAVIAARNDLEPPALALQPVIADVLAALRASRQCRLARMSGSGATCFALFSSARAAEQAARDLRAARPGWWVRATTLGP
jgi:4-diphosphocytidyl-2-C-methyl-D-erythritol kinase